MTAYDQVFYPIFGVGCAVAATASFLAARKAGFVFPVVALGVGIIAFWAALFIGSEGGYQTCQSIPEPPAEAFSDTAPMGALLLAGSPASSSAESSLESSSESLDLLDTCYPLAILVFRVAFPI
jgi:hypothetical protein